MTSATTTDKEQCGACGQEFQNLDDVFSHECSGLPETITYYHPTRRSDSVDAPEFQGRGGKSYKQVDKGNRYGGQCVKCGGRVEAEAGHLVKDNSQQRGGTVWGVVHKPGECQTVDEQADDGTDRGPAISDKQESFLRSLLAERQPDADPDGVIDVINQMPEPRKGASAMIDALKAIPKPPSTMTHTQDGIQEGFYVINTLVIKVQRAVHGSGNLYAKQLTINEDGGRGVFEYWSGGINQLRKALKAGDAEKLSLEKAKAIGQLYGMCCVCGATLTDERSIEAGIGPVCGKRLA